MPPAEINFCTFEHLHVDPFVEGHRLVGFLSSTVMPMLCATLRTLTLFTSLRLLVEEAADDGARHGINVREILRVTAVGNVQLVRAVGASCASNLPSASPSGRYGFTCSDVFASR